MTTAADILSERDFQRTVTDALERFGWIWTHFKPARTPDGRYLTRIEGHKGWPDIAAVRRGHFMLIECKSQDGRLSAEQGAWIDALRKAAVDVRVWRPSDMDAILEILR